MYEVEPAPHKLFCVRYRGFGMKLVEVKSRPSRHRIAAVVFWCALVLLIVLMGLQLLGGLTIVGRWTLPLINFVVLLAAFLALRGKRFWLRALLILVLLGNLAFFLVSNDGAEYRFISPQGSNTLVIREKSALVSSGQAELYRKEGIFLRRLEGNISAFDSYQPFAQGQYHLEWVDEETVLLAYYNGHGYQQMEINL